jgi:hypothetical protein
MVPRQFLILPKVTGRLGILKITISMRRKTHNNQTIYHSLNTDSLHRTHRLGKMNITISMRRKIHDTRTCHHLPNIDW